MTNVIQVTFPRRQSGRAARIAALLACTAGARRGQGDVFWLKENAELLNILECTAAMGQRSAPPAPDALAPFLPLYDTLEDRLAFFPQYYRFLLSICLDLEDLGIAGPDPQKGAALVAWAAKQGLPRAELSDLQRAEARRLMLRRGVDPIADSAGLTARLMDFISRPATFALPNKKAAYELTHIAFYLSEYGRKPLQLPEPAKKSFSFAGTLAYLDQNADLLAEVCVAMRHAGLEPPASWEDWLAEQTRAFAVGRSGDAMHQDAYHEYFVSNWALACAGRDSFQHDIPEGSVRFCAPLHQDVPLLAMSRHLMELGADRSPDWARMRGPICDALGSGAAVAHLNRAEASCSDFDAFFHGFARAGQPLPGQRRLA